MFALVGSHFNPDSMGLFLPGMSSQVGKMLGLEFDCSHLLENGSMTQDGVLDREVAYWSGLVMDTCWSLYVGRDCLLPPHKHIPDVPLPSIVPELDRIPWRHPESGLPPQYGYLSTTFEATCRLHVVGRLVLDVTKDAFEDNGVGIRDEVITAMEYVFRYLFLVFMLIRFVVTSSTNGR